MFSRISTAAALSLGVTGRWIGSAALVFGLSGPCAAMELPSGVEAELHEVLVEAIGGETWVRFRLLAAEIDRNRADAPGFGDLEQDFPHLCRTVALPYLETHGLDADRIVISIADREVEFGVTDPDATQYFEQFRVGDGTCIWEAF